MYSSSLLGLVVLSLKALAQNSSSVFTKYTISAPGINASFIPYGARLTNLYVNDKNGIPQDVVLGYDDGTQYLNDTETVHTYFGPVVGRYANRIKNGTFTINGITSHVPENEHMGADTLHGGNVGYDQRNWTIVEANSSTITFSLLDQGFEGFPGTIITFATYTVSAGPQWTSRLISIPLDEPTPIMLANHVYWNLDAFANPADLTILNNTLHMPYAARYIEIDNIEVPNGTIGIVNDTYLDFTSPKQIGSDIEEAVNGCGLGCTGYDNAFILDRPRYSAPECTDLSVLTMSSNVTGIQLDIRTNQQSLQIYTCDNLNGTIPVKQSQQHSINGSTTYVPQYGCVVIETQQWIGGINNPQWGQDQYQIYTVASEPAVVFAQYDFSIIFVYIFGAPNLPTKLQGWELRLPTDVSNTIGALITYRAVRPREMAQDDEMLFSSPDPLALSNENILTPSPAKAGPTKSRCPLITPRKPLVDASGNARVQDFLISTPPARRNSNSPTKSSANTASTSPWRIRLTVQAEQVEEKECEVRRNSSPTKRLAERTTTITVPLKGGDDSPPAVARRGRGRPRKSLDSPKKRNGTPKPKAGVRRKTVPNTQDDNNDISSLATRDPPKKARGRQRKSIEATSEAPQFVTDSLLSTPIAEIVDSAVGGEKATRTRGKGRRQEITPMRLAMDPDAECTDDFSRIAGAVPVVPEQTPDGALENSLLKPHSYQLDRLGLRQSASLLPKFSPEISVTKQKDEYMWRSMVQPQNGSPKAGHEVTQEQENVDPTSERYEYDTILESEGFSMVSTDSLASTGNQSNEPVKQHSILSNRSDTPAIAQSPSEPPALHDPKIQPMPRHVDESREGTPRLARVMHAGIALQGVLSPDYRVQRLDSPFGEPRKECTLTSAARASTTQALSSQTSKLASPKQRSDDIFGGCAAGTQRELRAGLRLGEELAKRKPNLAQKSETSSVPDEDIFRATDSLQYPPLPRSEAQVRYSLPVPSSQEGLLRGDVRYPRLSGDQLPTPERSEADADEDRMSWKADTPANLEVTARPTASVLSDNIEEGPDESSIDSTMTAREAEWQREREAISRQIQKANKSQVIVIDSDEENDDDVEDQEQNLDDDDEEHSDIWQAEAHLLERSGDATSEASGIMLQPEIIKPRRSKLPSPWRRSSQITYSDEPEPSEADLFRHAEQMQATVSYDGSEEKPLDDVEASYRSDDSTGALIARQLSPVKASNIEINNADEESLYKINHAGLPDGPRLAIIEPRQIRPVEGVDFAVTGKEASRSGLIGNTDLALDALHSEDSSQLKAEVDSVPATPENRYERDDPSAILNGNATITSMYDQSIDDSLDRSIVKSSGRAIGNDTASIDPHLLQPQKQTQKVDSKGQHASRPPIVVQPATPAQSSWISRVTAPIWSVLAPGPALPPPATKADILCSSPYEPLCQLTPWEPCHMRALGPLYLSSLLYGAHIFPFNPKSPAAAYYGITVTTSLGWSRAVTKRDCSVADAFMVILEERGFALGEPGEQWIEEGLAIRMCISIWVSMVMRGEIEVNASNGEKVGLRKEGDRLWTTKDISWKHNASEYFERKRREFDGLPSWKATGVKWPPQ